MPSGITGATITTLTNGTTANASDVMASLNSLKSNGVNNDSGNIVTDNSGNMTVVSVANGQGVIRGFYFLTTPYRILNNVTINSTNTNNYTCTGVGTPTIPSGATAVILSGYFSSSSSGAFLQIFPQGMTITNTSDANLFGTVQGANNVPCGFCICKLNASNGQISVKANSGNCSGIEITILGYMA